MTGSGGDQTQGEKQSAGVTRMDYSLDDDPDKGYPAYGGDSMGTGGARKQSQIAGFTEHPGVD